MDKPGKKKRLTPKRIRFVDEYLVDLNATQAAIRAGYSPKTAYSIGFEILKKPEIQDEIAKRRGELQEETEINQERIFQEESYLAFADVRQLFDQGGGMLPIHLLPEGVARAISSFEVVETPDGGQKIKVRLWDKGRALERLEKLFGLFPGTGTQSPGTDDILELGRSMARVIDIMDSTGAGADELDEIMADAEAEEESN